MQGISLPAAQTLPNYLLLALLYGSALCLRRQRPQNGVLSYAAVSLFDVEGNFLVVSCSFALSFTTMHACTQCQMTASALCWPATPLMRRAHWHACWKYGWTCSGSTLHGGRDALRLGLPAMRAPRFRASMKLVLPVAAPAGACVPPHIHHERAAAEQLHDPLRLYPVRALKHNLLCRLSVLVTIAGWRTCTVVHAPLCMHPSEVAALLSHGCVSIVAWGCRPCKALYRSGHPLSVLAQWPLASGCRHA